MKRPQFTLTDLVWTVGLLALACAGAGIIVRTCVLGELVPDPIPLSMFLVVQTPVSLCAGLAAPFHRKEEGTRIGVCIMVFGPILAVAFL